MQRDDLVRQIEGDPVLREHAAWLRAAIRPAVPLRFEGAGDRSGGGRFGGAPDLPPGVEWPRHRFGPYRFLGQLDLAELAVHAAAMDPPWRGLLPTAGLLSLFVGDDPTGEIDPSGEMFWGDPTYAIAHYAPPGAELARLSPPTEVDFGSAVGVTYARGVELPFDGDQLRGVAGASAVAKDRARLDAIADALDALRGEPPCADHLFGYPAHCSLAYDPTPAGMLPLLTLVSSRERAWTWHDGDCLMLFVAPGSVVPGWIALGSDAG
jgi:hypothetical protein